MCRGCFDAAPRNRSIFKHRFPSDFSHFHPEWPISAAHRDNDLFTAEGVKARGRGGGGGRGGGWGWDEKDGSDGRRETLLGVEGKGDVGMEEEVATGGRSGGVIAWFLEVSGSVVSAEGTTSEGSCSVASSRCALLSLPNSPQDKGAKRLSPFLLAQTRPAGLLCLTYTGWVTLA